jgi:hypothetical protein
VLFRSMYAQEMIEMQQWMHYYKQVGQLNSVKTVKSYDTLNLF